MAYVFLLCLGATALKVAEYRFYDNFGDYFTDYSGNEHPAINGLTIYKENQDTIPTSLGAYFTFSNVITLPPNSRSLAFDPAALIFNKIFWIFIKSGGNIESINSTEQNIFSLSLSSENLIFKDNYNTFTIEKLNFAFISQWIMIGMYLEASNYKISVNGIIHMQITSIDYIPSVLSNTLGSSSASFNGYLWNYKVYSEDISLSTMVSTTLYSDANCIRNNCTSECSVSMMSYETQYCMPIVPENVFTDISGEPCYNTYSNKVGCYLNISLYCQDSHSCVISGNKIIDQCERSNTESCKCPISMNYKLGECISCNKNLSKCLCSVIGSYDNNICQCPPTYYLNASTGTDICVPCNSDCKTCTNEKLCTSCNYDFMLPDASAGCYCTTGYYRNIEKCLPCRSGCLDCTKLDLCLICQDPNASPSYGYCNCNIGYYLSGTCQPCSSNCWYCYNSLSCYSCAPKYYLDNEVCLPCLDPCSSCNNGVACTSCVDIHALPNEEGVCICIAEYYKSQGTCVYCAPGCATCSEGVYCDTCVDNSIANPSGGCSCIEAYYYFGRRCYQCGYRCSSCYNNAQCNSCYDSHASPNQFGGCSCNIGYYDSEGTCFLCKDICIDCSNGLSCTTCKDPNAHPDQSGGCSCNTKYYSYEGTCTPCANTCGACNNGIDCISCVDSNASPVSGKGCICNSGYFTTNDLCSPCSDRCATCVEAFVCESCISFSTANEGGGCDCNYGYYFDQKVCNKCSEVCATCVDGQSCSICADINASPLASGGCKCNQGYYSNEGLCTPCSSPCSSCENGTHCTVCKDSNAHPFQEGGCTCNQGFYDYEGTCTACLTKCVSCLDGSSCVECKDLNALPEDCRCKQGYYDSQEVCTACTAGCADCVDDTKCISCIPNAFENENGGCNCNDGYYYSEGECILCNFPCNKCIDSLVCITCYDINASPIRTGGCSCNVGYYNNRDACIACDPLCADCTDSATCVTCKDINAVPNANTVCSCIDGYFIDSLVCKPCASICSTCSNSLACTVCKDPNASPIGTECLCNAGYFNLHGTCTICPDLCSDCEDSSTCTSCISNASLTQSKICSCNDRFYPNQKTCDSCDSSCLTCADGSNCLTCNDLNASPINGKCTCHDGYYQSSLSCSACNTVCATCTDGITCSTCKDFNAIPSLQGCSCKPEFYKNGELCDACASVCSTCSNNIRCDTCKDINSSPVLSGGCSCNLGFFDLNGICTACSDRCTSCVSAISCSSCVENSSFDNLGGCACNLGYYFGQGACQPCANECLDCIDGASCSSCKDQNASPVQGICSCKPGFFSNLGICYACISVCASCSNSLTCDTCKDLNALPGDGGCICNNGYYQDNEGICSPCISECKTCVDSISCESCNDLNASPSQCLCNLRFFKFQGVCTACPEKCIACTSQLICSDCIEYASINSNGLCDCNENYYYLEGSCLHCGPGCRSCTKGDACISCIDPHASVDLLGMCVCNIGYYNVEGICYPCPNLCVSCTDYSSCSGCKDSNAVISLTEGCTCIDGFFNNEGVCSECMSDCATCTSNYLCSSCKDINASPSLNGGCKCNPRYYLVQGYCTLCSGACETCLISLTCTSCIENAYLDSNNICSCKRGYIYIEGSCVQCPYMCYPCDSEIACTTCNDPNAVALESGGCSCLVGYYNDCTDCLACPLSCKTCLSSSVCSTCKDPNALPIPEGICKCKVGYFGDGITCTPCLSICLACTSLYDCTICSDVLAIPSSNGCSCPDGYYNKNGVCTTCFPGCSICESEQTCTQCADINASPAPNACVCKDGFYYTPHVCTPCYNGCLKCSDQLSCNVCVDPNALPNGMSCECKVGYFINSGICEACFNECDSCYTFNLCETCVTLNAEPSIIKGCNCKLGFYGTSLTTVESCNPCAPQCSECNDGLTCSACIDPNAYLDSDKLCSCNPSYYKDNISCLPCFNECSTCSTNLLCIHCLDPNASPNNIQGCSCNSGYYRENLITTQFCLSCHSHCSTCSEDLKCISCKSFNSIPDLTEGCVCNNGYFPTDLSLQNGCSPCYFECSTCNNPFTCLSCIDPKAAVNSTGSCACIQGYYNNSNICSKCFDGCFECSDGFKCSSCVAANSRPKIDQGCACNSGYFEVNISDAGGCRACRSDCQTCVDTIKCKTCITELFMSTEGLCVDRCSAGDTVLDKNCSSVKQMIFSFTFDGLNNSYVYGVYSLYMGVIDSFWPTYDTSDPWILPGRGGYFSQNSVATLGSYRNPENFYLGNSHTFDMFINVFKDGLILSVNNGTTYSMTFNATNGKLIIYYSIKNLTSADRLIGEYNGIMNSWVRISWGLNISFPALTLTCNINAKQAFQYSAENYRYSQTNITLLKIGASLALNSFTGYLYKISYYNYQLTTFLNAPACKCDFCTDTGSCLNNCPPDTYQDSTCKKCLAQCSYGCARGSDCSPYPDPNCMNYNNLTAPCKNCQPLYDLVNTTCARCVRYLNNSDLSANFTSSFSQILFSFNVSISPITCAEIFTNETLSKFGINYNCELLQKMNGVLISLGQNNTIVNETISLNESVLRGAASECGYNKSSLSVKIGLALSPPVPVAVIKAPSLIFYECQDLELDGRLSSGKLNSSFSYKWNVRLNGNELIAYSTNFSSNDSLTIPGSALAKGSLTVSLSVKTKFNITNSTEITIMSNISNGLSIEIKEVDKLECISSKTCVFNIYNISSCVVNPIYNITWGFKSQPIDMNLSESVNFLSLQPSSKSLKINENTFSPQILSMSISVIDVKSKLKGELNIKINILPAPPSIVFKPSMGFISLISDTNIDASQSVEPSLLNFTSFEWYCSYKGAECAFTYPKIGSAMQISKQILASQLYDYLVLMITIEVPLGRRLHGRMLGNTLIQQSNSTYSGEFVPWLVPNVTLNDFYTGLQPKFIPSSKELVINATVTDLDNYTVSWSLNSSIDAFSSSPNNTNIFINVSLLTPGEQYRLTFVIIPDLGHPSKFYYDFTVNTPPALGSFQVSPMTGIEMLTDYSLIASEWVDAELNYPLSYSFGYMSHGAAVFYVINSPEPMFKTKLPYNPAATEMILRVYDSFGDYTDSFSYVVVNIDHNYNMTAMLNSVNDSLNSAFPSELPSIILLTTSAVLNRALLVPSSSGNKTQDIENGNALVEQLQNSLKVYINNCVPSQEMVDQSLQIVTQMTENPDLVNNKNLNGTLSIVDLLINVTGNSVNPSDAPGYLDVLNKSIPININTIYNNTQGIGLMMNFTESVENGMANSLVPQVSYTVTSEFITNSIINLDTADLSNYTMKISDNSNAKVALSDDISAYLGPGPIALSSTHVNTPNSYTNSTPSLISVSFYKDNKAIPIKLNSSFITIHVPVQNISTIKNVTCVYFDTDYNRWNTTGCILAEVLDDVIVCNCSHLSLFSAGEGLVGGGFFPENNIEDTVNFSALQDINATNAIGFYFIFIIIVIYIIVAILSYRLDRKDLLKSLRINTITEFDKENNVEFVIDNFKVAPLDSIMKEEKLHNSVIDEHSFTDRPAEDEKVYNTPVHDVSFCEKPIEVEEAKENDYDLSATKQSFHHHLSNSETEFQLNSTRMGNTLESNFNSIGRRIKNTLGFDELQRQITKKIKVMQNHKFFSLFYLYTPEKTRLARATLFFFNIVGNMFFMGLFYSQNNSKSTALTFSESLVEYGWRDFLVFFYSFTIMFAIEAVVAAVAKNQPITDKHTPAEVQSLLRKNKIRSIAGLVISWLVMIYFCWSIAMFALQFNIGVSYKWVLNSGVKFLSDIFFTSFLIAALKTFVIFNIIDKIKARKNKQRVMNDPAENIHRSEEA